MGASTQYQEAALSKANTGSKASPTGNGSIRAARPSALGTKWYTKRCQNTSRGK
jgi:hypothetical protein